MAGVTALVLLAVCLALTGALLSSKRKVRRIATWVVLGMVAFSAIAVLGMFVPPIHLPSP